MGAERGARRPQDYVSRICTSLEPADGANIDGSMRTGSERDTWDLSVRVGDCGTFEQ